MSEEIVIINGKEVNLISVHHLLAENRKIEAIKIIMDQANIGLADAKNFVENLVETKVPSTADDDILQAIKNLLKDNRKIEAVKLAKFSTGLGLKESKDLVENIDSMTLEDLLAVLKGKSVSSFSSEIQILNSKGELNDVHSVDKTSDSGDKKDANKARFEEDSSGNKTKTIILILAAIAAVAIYFYYR